MLSLGAPVEPAPPFSKRDGSGHAGGNGKPVGWMGTGLCHAVSTLQAFVMLVPSKIHLLLGSFLWGPSGLTHLSGASHSFWGLHPPDKQPRGPGGGAIPWEGRRAVVVLATSTSARANDLPLNQPSGDELG